MPRLRFGVFLAPHHPIGEHPTLQIRRDLDLVTYLDELGYDEFWCGEHHSGAWETIASPEMFLAAAGENTKRIIIRLLREDRPFSYKSDWFELNEAQLQIKPLQEDLPIVAASTISPAGMKSAGKYNVGVISIASATEEGLAALPTQWGFGETYAAEHGNTMDRSKWRINANIHIAPTKEQAIEEIADGLLRWHNEYNVDILGRPGSERLNDAKAFATRMANAEGSMIGTPEDVLKSIGLLQKRSGGFGTLISFAHDWAPREAQYRSYEMLARYVVPKAQGLLEPVERSARFVGEHKGELMEKANKAVLGAIRAHNATHPKPEPATAAGGD
ncbi:MAG TPA: LLM class flavin-dependent oxidoreductase [Tepidiformaceae bacterium]|nr:LLM class flavin-dependent oxidoreductase [Tepidiformaceae bacterium]